MENSISQHFNLWIRWSSLQFAKLVILKRCGHFINKISISNRCAHTFSSFNSDSNFVFNRQGTRLIGGIRMEEPLTVVDIPSLTTGDTAAADSGRVLLSAQGFSFPSFGRNKFCFAGQDDDLVVSSSEVNDLYVWSLPESRQGNAISVNQSLLELHGHEQTVLTVRYDPATTRWFLPAPRRSSSCVHPFRSSDTPSILFSLLWWFNYSLALIADRSPHSFCNPTSWCSIVE